MWRGANEQNKILAAYVDRLASILHQVSVVHKSVIHIHRLSDRHSNFRRTSQSPPLSLIAAVVLPDWWRIGIRGRGRRGVGNLVGLQTGVDFEPSLDLLHWRKSCIGSELRLTSGGQSGGLPLSGDRDWLTSEVGDDWLAGGGAAGNFLTSEVGGDGLAACGGGGGGRLTSSGGNDWLTGEVGGDWLAGAVNGDWLAGGWRRANGRPAGLQLVQELRPPIRTELKELIILTKNYVPI